MSCFICFPSCSQIFSYIQTYACMPCLFLVDARMWLTVWSILGQWLHRVVLLGLGIITEKNSPIDWLKRNHRTCCSMHLILLIGMMFFIKLYRLYLNYLDFSSAVWTDLKDLNLYRYPWGEEAFQKAKSENKPIFLSGE